MNFYSDEIINHIIDDAPLENMMDELENLKEKIRKSLHRFTANEIQANYIDGLLGDEKNKVVFYCMDFEFDIDNCPVMMIYRKSRDTSKDTSKDTSRDTSKDTSRTSDNIEIRYYILMLCTKPTFRNQGYATRLLDGFCEKIQKNKPSEEKCTRKIILSSVETAVLFYEAYGFRWTTDTLTDHPILMLTEKKEEGKEYFIMEMTV
jgi:ribosomal protein S18 acetylase RimI-like enzyme